MKVTPSQLPMPVFVLCPPTFVDTSIPNNKWMTKAKKEELVIDKEKFIGQWYNFYQVLASNAIVYLLPAKSGLQDQTYVNCAAYLTHYKERDTIVLSNFTAKGRQGEEKVAYTFFKELGYNVVKCPYKFEGEPELKYLRDNIYLGGYGIRSDINAHYWIEEKFGAKIIKIKETDDYLYHLDCSLFVLNKENVLMHTEGVSKKTLREIEKLTNIISVSTDAAYQGICNSLRVGDIIFNASLLPYIDSGHKYYNYEITKNQELEAACDKVGLELVYFDLSEAMKSGALLSCFAMHLNYRNLAY